MRRLEYSDFFQAVNALPELRYEFNDPEPATLLLCSAGAAAVGVMRRRRRLGSRRASESDDRLTEPPNA